EPSSALIAFPPVKGFPQPPASGLQGKRQRCHLDSMLMMVGSSPPIFFAGGIGAEHKASAEPFGDVVTREFFVRPWFAAQPMCGKQARTREGFETISLGTVITRLALKREVRLAWSHQIHERL